jgi:hypothetical protein
VAEEQYSAFTPEKLEAELERSRQNAARLLESLAVKLHSGPILRQASSGFNRAAEYIRDSSMKDYGSRLNRVICRWPATSILVAVAAGFLTARALRHR